MLHTVCRIIFWGLSAFTTSEASTVPSARSISDKHGTFEDPGPHVRPRFRYWVPDASIDGRIIAADIKSAGSIGAGGVEFLPFFNYGGEHGAPPKGANWSTFAFGSPAFRDLLVKALQAHEQADLYMDMAIGPNQGQGVPARPDDEGLQWDLVSRPLCSRFELCVDESDSVHQHCVP